MDNHIEATPDPLHPRYVGIVGIIRDREANGEDPQAEVQPPHRPGVLRVPAPYNMRAEPKMEQPKFTVGSNGNVPAFDRTHWVQTSCLFRKDENNVARGLCIICGVHSAEFFRSFLSCVQRDSFGNVLEPGPEKPWNWPSGPAKCTRWIKSDCLWLREGKPLKPAGDCLYCNGEKIRTAHTDHTQCDMALPASASTVIWFVKKYPCPGPRKPVAPVVV